MDWAPPCPPKKSSPPHEKTFKAKKKHFFFFWGFYPRAGAPSPCPFLTTPWASKKGRSQGLGFFQATSLVRPGGARLGQPQCFGPDCLRPLHRPGVGVWVSEPQAPGRHQSGHGHRHAQDGNSVPIVVITGQGEAAASIRNRCLSRKNRHLSHQTLPIVKHFLGGAANSSPDRSIVC